MSEPFSLSPALELSRIELGLGPDLEPSSYTLDNAAIIMPAVANGRSTSLFRISADLDAEVDRKRLQLALDRTLPRFPYFAVSLERGFFWYRLVPIPGGLKVEDEALSPCQDFNPNRRGTCLFRIRARGPRIAGEFSHLVGDGRGGIRFMKTLIAEYCRLGGRPALETHPDIYSLASRPQTEEYEDAYLRHYRPGLPAPELGQKAFRLPGALLKEGDYRITTATLPLVEALAVAKARGVSLTELVSAVYLEALQKVWLATPEGERKAWGLAVEIPVDLRRYYPTGTNRNFTLYTIVGEDMRLGQRSFSDLLCRLSHRFRLENDEASLARHISRNVTAMLNPLLGFLPLRLKDLGARLVFKALGENYVSGVVTNLGAIDFPAGLESQVLRFDLIQPPSAATRMNIAMHSHRGILYVTLCSLLEKATMEDHILDRLRELGLEPRVECNLA